MKQPKLSDFEANVEGSEVIVHFKPSESEICFGLLEHGRVSSVPNIRHAGQSGDTGEYDEDDVVDMARDVARATARSAGIR
jgi:hypothetical protein